MKIGKPLLGISLVLIIAYAASRRGHAQDAQPQSATSAERSGESAPQQTFPAPSKIYVADFYLDPAAITNAKLRQREAALQRRRARQEEENDPEEKARKLVSTLAESIVAELQSGGQNSERIANAKGLRAEFIPADVDLPKEGWLVAGWFSKVDEGNRAVSSTIGLGAGSESVDIDILVYDLSKGTNEPFLQFYTGTKPKRAPGAIVTMNPISLGVKFVLSKKSTARDVKKQGKIIADNLLQCIQPAPGVK